MYFRYAETHRLKIKEIKNSLIYCKFKTAAMFACPHNSFLLWKRWTHLCWQTYICKMDVRENNLHFFHLKNFVRCDKLIFGRYMFVLKFSVKFIYRKNSPTAILYCADDDLFKRPHVIPMMFV